MLTQRTAADLDDEVRSEYGAAPLGVDRLYLDTPATLPIRIGRIGSYLSTWHLRNQTEDRVRLTHPVLRNRKDVAYRLEEELTADPGRAIVPDQHHGLQRGGAFQSAPHQCVSTSPPPGERGAALSGWPGRAASEYPIFRFFHVDYDRFCGAVFCTGSHPVYAGGSGYLRISKRYQCR